MASSCLVFGGGLYGPLRGLPLGRCAGKAGARAGNLERDVVVAAILFAKGLCARDGGGGACAFLAAAEELDALGDDLDDVALLAVLRFPLPRLQAALDHDGPALVEVLTARFGLFTPHHHGEEAGVVTLLATLGREAAVDGDAHVGYGGSAGRVPELGRADEVSDQEDLVQARH